MTMEERTEAAVALIEGDDFSYLQVAETFGVSRSIIAGLIYRYKDRGGVITKRRVIAGTFIRDKAKREKVIAELNAKTNGKLLEPKARVPRISASRSEMNLKKVAPIPRNQYVPVPPPVGLSLLDITNDTCRWPQGTGPYSFCGAPTALSITGRKVYCAAHNFLAYRAFEPREKTNAKPYGKTLSLPR